jgi:hypothetical protein
LALIAQVVVNPTTRVDLIVNLVFELPVFDVIKR